MARKAFQATQLFGFPRPREVSYLVEVHSGLEYFLNAKLVLEDAWLTKILSPRSMQLFMTNSFLSFVSESYK